MTVAAVALGTAWGFVTAVCIAFLPGLLTVAAASSFGAVNYDLLLSIIAAIISAPAIATTTALCTDRLVDKARSNDQPKYREGPRTVLWAAIVNGLGVLIVSLLMAFLVPPAGAFELVGRPLVWPVWFVVVGVLARWLALSARRIPFTTSSRD